MPPPQRSLLKELIQQKLNLVLSLHASFQDQKLEALKTCVLPQIFLRATGSVFNSNREPNLLYRGNMKMIK